MLECGFIERIFYITVHSIAHRYGVMSKTFNVKNSRAGIPNKDRQLQDRQLSADMLVANSQHKVRGQHAKGEPLKPCIFCKGMHFNDNCDKYSIVTNRKSQLTSQGKFKD